MTQQPYKAVIRFPISETALGNSVISNAKLEAAFKEIEVRVWLDNHSFEQPIIIYDNTDPQAAHGSLVVVHADRDAVLLLKLAFS